MHDREPSNNIGFVCPEHRPRPRVRWLDYSCEWFIGRYVKLAFPTDPPPPTLGLTEEERKRWPETEHMWVKAEGLADPATEHELFGWLSNDPVFVRLPCGEGIAFNRDEIEDVMGFGRAVNGGEDHGPAGRRPAGEEGHR